MSVSFGPENGRTAAASSPRTLREGINRADRFIEGQQSSVWQSCGMIPVAVLGPGGVGGFIAGALARAGIPVTVVARDRTAELIARNGITVQSVRLGGFRACPDARSRLDTPVDVLVIATKAGGLAAALDRIRVEPDLVVP